MTVSTAIVKRKQHCLLCCNLRNESNYRNIPPPLFGQSQLFGRSQSVEKLAGIWPELELDGSLNFDSQTQRLSVLPYVAYSAFPSFRGRFMSVK